MAFPVAQWCLGIRRKALHWWLDRIWLSTALATGQLDEQSAVTEQVSVAGVVEQLFDQVLVDHVADIVGFWLRYRQRCRTVSTRRHDGPRSRAQTEAAPRFRPRRLHTLPDTLHPQGAPEWLRKPLVEVAHAAARPTTPYLAASVRGIRGRLSPDVSPVPWRVGAGYVGEPFC